MEGSRTHAACISSLLLDKDFSLWANVWSLQICIALYMCVTQRLHDQVLLISYAFQSP